MTQRLLYIDPLGECSSLINQLRLKGIICKSLTDSPRQMLETMLESENVLLVACDEMVKTPMIAAVSSWMTVIAFECPLVADTQWITLSRTSPDEEQLELILGTLLRGDHGRKRTRISIPLKVWIQGIGYTVVNSSLKELWIDKWAGSNSQSEFDGILELPGDRGKIPVQIELLVRRESGCAMRFTPSTDIGLLMWLDYFLDGLHKTPISERVKPLKEFFDET